MTTITKAVFPVAGLGTRLVPATKAMPKEMLTLVDRPLIQYAVDEARAAGITEFIFVTSRGKGAIEDYFDAAPCLEEKLRKSGKARLLAELEATSLPSGAVACVRQNEPLGLGHAIHCARGLVGNEPFAVLLPDDVIAAERPCLSQMVEAYERLGATGSLCATMEVDCGEVSKYGILAAESTKGRLVRATGLVEKPRPEDAPSRLAVVGRYILAPSVLDRLATQAPGSGGEIQLTDAIAGDVESGVPVHGFRFEGERFDCGSREGFLTATVAFALRRDDTRAVLQSYLGRADVLPPLAAE